MEALECTHAVVVHKDPLMRAGLAHILGALQDIAVSIADTLNDLGQIATIRPIQVVVTDYQRGLDFLAGSRDSAVAPAQTTPKVLIVTQIASEWEARAAMNAGVSGYILQGCSADEIACGIRTLGRGRPYMCQRISQRIAESLTRVSLTARETEVLKLLTEGHCNKAIAKTLGVAPGTVKAHVKRVLEKLDATSRTQAVAVASQRGLIRDDSHAPHLAGVERVRQHAVSRAPSHRGESLAVA